MAMKIACFSVAAMDYFPKIDRYHAGGNSLNQAIRFRHLGHQSAFIGALGTDRAGDRMAELLAAEAVDCSHMVRLKGETASNVIVNDEDGERFGVEGAWRSGVYADFRLSQSDWVYIHGFDVWTTHANCPDYLTALEQKTERQFMSVDFLHLQDYELLNRSLDVIDVAFFGGTPEMADELARVAQHKNGLVVLTLGAEGSMAFYGSEFYRQPALPMDKVIDTTGCGDAFQAGFVASFIQNRDLPAALLSGAEMGRIAAGAYGGVSWE